MIRLAAVTCLVLGTALAKPSPSAKSKESSYILPFRVKSVPYEDKPEPITFQEGERKSYTLASGSYYFTSPNYPSSYPNNYHGWLTVKGDSNQTVTITCDPFRMESHSSCNYDFLSINDVKYCGTNAPPTTTVTELRIIIKTDYSVTSTGFYCLVTVGCRCGQRQTRIVGGEDATLGEFPWQAGLVHGLAAPAPSAAAASSTTATC